MIEKNKGTLVFIPPYTTCVCQPLDVNVFGPFKQKMRKLRMMDKRNLTNTMQKRENVILKAIESFNSLSTELVVRSWEKSVLQKHTNNIENILCVI